MELESAPSKTVEVLQGLYSKLTTFGTPRFDSNGIHRSWSYDSDNEDELNSINQLAKYANSHGIPQRCLNVWTDNNRIHYNIRSFMFDPVHNRFKHYLVYPDWARSNDSSNNTYWSISFERATKLDPEYHSRCVFYHTGTCDYCNGVNENQIG